jgi:C-terminal processing protease CtpA/Prc
MNEPESRPASTSRYSLAILGVALLACAAAAAWGFVRGLHLQQVLRAREQELAALQEVVRSAKHQVEQLQVSHDELERYRKQAEEVPRLRGQYQEWQRLKEEQTALKAELDRLRAGLMGSPAAAQPPAATSRGSWIGVALGPGPSGSEVAVSVLAPGGPAANAGVQIGDLILAVDSRPVTTFQEVKEMIRAKPAGQLVLLDLSRNGVRSLLSVPTSPMPAFD